MPKFNDAQRLSESVIMQGLSLAESRRWRDYSATIRESYRRKFKNSIPNELLSTTAQVLENTFQYAQAMDETTRQVNFGNFVDYGFDVISTIVPNLIAPDLFSVQAMNAKHGAIFYLQYLYGNAKGSIAAGSVMNSPFTGQDSNFNFSNEYVEGEVVGIGDGTEDAFTTTLGFNPVKTGTAKVYVGTTLVAEVASTANGIDTLAAVASSGITGTVNLATGEVALAAAVGKEPAADAQITINYYYNMDETTVGFSQIDLDLKSVSIEAFPRKLRARWLLDGAWELQKMKGINAETELITAMSSELKHEIDAEILAAVYKQAGLTGYTWSAQMPTNAAHAYVDYKRTIIDVFTEMSNDIFQATRRVGANFIVAGVDVCNIIETLPEFDADALGTKIINGPHFIGTLGGRWKVYKNPYYNSLTFMMGYKGQSYLDAGFVYAPYMPVYTTPTQVLDDFIFRKGLATSYGQIMLNNKLYAKGAITGFSADRYKPEVVGP